MFEALALLLVAIVAIVFLVPLTVCLLYFSVHRARARGDDSAARYRNRKKRFKRIVNRALLLLLLLVCLFALVLAVMFAQLHWLGAVSGWGFGIFAWTGAELVLLALLGICGAYFGYALANSCLPDELKE